MSFKVILGKALYYGFDKDLTESSHHVLKNKAHI